MPKWPSRKEKETVTIEKTAGSSNGATSSEVEASPASVEVQEAAVPALTDEDREAAIAEYVRSQEAKLQQTLEKRKKVFAERLQSQRETHAQIDARQLRIKKLRQEIVERQDVVRKLKQEVRDLRPKRAHASVEVSSHTAV